MQKPIVITASLLTGSQSDGVLGVIADLGAEDKVIDTVGLDYNTDRTTWCHLADRALLARGWKRSGEWHWNDGESIWAEVTRK